MAILLKNGLMINQSPSAHSFATGDILIDGDRIIGKGTDLSARAAEFKDVEIIDATDKIVLPGFIDAHMHSNEGFEMGRYDNLPLEIWLSEVYPPLGAPHLSWRDHYLRAMLIAIISLKSGVTTLQDDVINISGTPDAVDATATAFRDAGLRGWITASMWDESYCNSLPFVSELMPKDLKAQLDATPAPDWKAQIDLFEELSGKWHGTDNMRIILGPCGPQRCSEKLLQEVASLSEARDLPVHCHVLETKTQAVTGAEKYGRTLVQFLKDMGLMTHRLTMNHAIWLTDEDIATMGAAGCSTTHNPLANLKLGSGVSPVRKLKNAGVNVALGCDGVASADTADIFVAFKAAAGLHKIGSFDYQDWVSAHEVYDMATTAGARSSLMEDEVGTLEEGMLADVILLDKTDWAFMPLHDPIKKIAFSANSDVVTHSIVGGKVVMRDRKLTLVSEADLRGEIAEAAARFERDNCPLMSKGAAPVRPYLDQMYEKAIARDMGLNPRVKV
ncbi:amidohydrolase family protein [uncultured Cohaesibacter sp.]|uniref:amidohydrolase family protein n=1 Tax=uncultured Cohaesibacter sp. TaxID=1002546 RepID=UPI0029C661B4|nr:amidohydrolase family protein [uncultured Cohaesibacter sp.]